MTTFFDLFAPSSKGPDSWTDSGWADARFPALADRGPFRIWHPGDGFPDQGQRILIGVATWSGYDMRLLDVIAERLVQEGPNNLFELFNTAECKRPRDFEDYVPNRWGLIDPPVGGIWLDGKLEWSGHGAEARDHLARLFGSNSDEIVRYVQDWIAAQPMTREA